MASNVHLVRHGEVENPNHVVYADLQEYVLSATGRAQARAVGMFLSGRPIGAVYSSPLTRALQTAEVIAAPHEIEVTLVEELTEYGLSRRWRGFRWEELDDRFPGEIDAYLAHPWNLPFSPESLGEMTDRMVTAIRRWHAVHPEGELVVVSHQDPVQAARLALAGRSIYSFGDDKPEHAEVITMEPNAVWREIARWEPPFTSGPFPPRREGRSNL